jgi:chemotaxis protein MotB
MPDPLKPYDAGPEPATEIVANPAGAARPASRTGLWLAWALAGLCLVGFGIGLVAVHLPQQQEHAKILAEYQRALADVARLVEEVETLEDKNARLLGEKLVLEDHKSDLETDKGELQKTQEELARELALKTAALEKYRQAQSDLNRRLQAEIAKGEVLVRSARGQLVVDLVDKVMFDSGEVELNESGKDVLRRVAETLRNMPDELILVGGHTDNVPISDKLIERYPTNWELSTARATGVVRFLQDECRVPAAQMAAVGYSEYRPVASNQSRHGRRRNRRIEVILLPRPAEH